jgi:flagellin
LTVTIDSSAKQTATDIATAIGSATVDGATPAAALFSAVGGAGVYFDAAEAPDAFNTGNSGGEVLNADLVFQLNGSNGAETFNFKAGASASQIASAINLVSDATNVTAAVSSGALNLTSSDYGSKALVDLEVITEGTGGTFKAGLNTARDTGADIVATVNGVSAKGNANTLSINTATLDLSLTVTAGSSTNFAFTISGGGAQFQLGGDVVSNQQARLGIGSVSTGKLGGANGRLYELGSGQAKALATDPSGAGKVIEEVINKVTSLRGRLGAFQSTTLESNLVSLNDTVANLTEAESSIRDADFAKESAALTRAQILVQSGTSVLGIANQNPQNVLALLR